jgi:hypothetical protein
MSGFVVVPGFKFRCQSQIPNFRFNIDRGAKYLCHLPLTQGHAVDQGYCFPLSLGAVTRNVAEVML